MSAAHVPQHIAVASPVLQNPSTTSLRDAYLYYCTQYQLKPNSDIRATLSTEQGAYDLQSLKLDGNFVGNNGILPLVEVLRLSTKLQVPMCMSIYVLHPRTVQDLQGKEFCVA